MSGDCLAAGPDLISSVHCPECGRCGMVSNHWNNKSVQWCVSSPIGTCCFTYNPRQSWQKSEFSVKAKLNCSRAQFQLLRWNYRLHWLPVKCSFTATYLMRCGLQPAGVEAAAAPRLPTYSGSLLACWWGSLPPHRVTGPVPTEGEKHTQCSSYSNFPGVVKFNKKTVWQWGILKLVYFKLRTTWNFHVLKKATDLFQSEHAEIQKHPRSAIIILGDTPPGNETCSVVLAFQSMF